MERVHSRPDPAASVIQEADPAFVGPSDHSGEPRPLAWLAEFLQVVELKNSSNQHAGVAVDANAFVAAAILWQLARQCRKGAKVGHQDSAWAIEGNSP